MNQELPTTITKRLQAVLNRVRRIQFLRGMFGVITCSLAVVLFIMAMDYFFSPLSVNVRWVLFALLVLTVTGSFWQLFVKPLNRRIELLQIARWLEIKHPELQERISTAMELSGSSGSGISAGLIEELIAEAEVDVQSLNPQVEVKAKKLKTWLWPSCALAAVFLSLFIIWPDQVSRLLVRAVAPFSQTGNAGAIAFDIQPGDIEVLEGDAVNIRVLYDGSPNDVLTLVSSKEDGTETEEQLEFSGKEDGKLVIDYQLATAKKSFRYKVRAGRKESDGYDVTVWPKPQIAGLESTYEYPDYTGMARAKRGVGAAGIRALTGTKILLQATPNTPVESGVLMIDDQKICDINIERNASGGMLNCSFPMTEKLAGTGRVILTHRLGHEIEVARFPVQSLTDEAPVISLLSPVKREFKLRPTDELPITYQVVEKIGLHSAELLLRVNGKDVPPLPQVLPSRAEPIKHNIWKGEVLFSVGDLLQTYPKARQLELSIKVRDNCPEEFGGPHHGTSEKIILRISRGAESLVRQELRAQDSDIRETARKAEKEIREAAAKMQQQKEQIKKDEPNEHTRKELEKAREQLAKAEKALEELAERMENGVHAQKVEDVKQAAEKAKESREHLETTPLQDTPKERENELEQAQDAAEEAIEALQKLNEKMNKDRQKVEDIAKLNELAQKERDIARQAEQHAQEENPNKRDAEKIAEQQKQVQEEIRRELNERPEAVAEAAKKQAEEARELAQEARDQSEQQKDLEQAARDAAKEDDPQAEQKREEAIREQLKKEQANVVEEAKEQLDQARENQEQRANELPEAVENAEEALDQIGEKKDAEAAEAAREAAEQLEQAAKAEKDKAQQGENQQADEAEQAGNESPKQDAQNGEQPDGKENNSAENKEGQQGDNPEEQKGDQQGENQEGDQAGDQQGDKEDPELEELADRQEKIAEALEALEEGDIDKAQADLQQLQADAAEELADDVQAVPEINGKSGEMAQAERAAQQAENQAQEAAKQAEQGNQQAAAENNAEAAKALDQAADALDAQAEKLDAQAAQAEAQANSEKGQQAAENQAPADGKQLAEAFEKAAEAAQAQSPQEAADAAKEAADALSELAQQAMQNMQQGNKPGQKGKPGEKPGQQMADAQPSEPSDKSGEKPKEGMRLEQAAPGVPPELAKLGVSIQDWEKLKEMMKSDVGGAGSADIPDDYRNLVRLYFEQIASEGKESE